MDKSEHARNQTIIEPRQHEKTPKRRKQSQIKLKAAESQSTMVDLKEFRRLLRKIVEEDRKLLEQIGRL